MRRPPCRPGAIEAAVDSVNKYLAAAGRAGEFYREALELLVRSEQRLLEQEADNLPEVIGRRRVDAGGTPGSASRPAGRRDAPRRPVEVFPGLRRVSGDGGAAGGRSGAGAATR